MEKKKLILIIMASVMMTILILFGMVSCSKSNGEIKVGNITIGIGGHGTDELIWIRNDKTTENPFVHKITENPDGNLEPSDDNTSIYPDDDKTTEQPGDDKTTEQSGDDKTTEQPGDDKTTERPGDDRTTENPDDDKTTERPGDDKTTERPGDDRTTENPDDDKRKTTESGNGDLYGTRLYQNPSMRYEFLYDERMKVVNNSPNYVDLLDEKDGVYIRVVYTNKSYSRIAALINESPSEIRDLNVEIYNRNYYARAYNCAVCNDYYGTKLTKPKNEKFELYMDSDNETNYLTTAQGYYAIMDGKGIMVFGVMPKSRSNNKKDLKKIDGYANVILTSIEHYELNEKDGYSSTTLTYFDTKDSTKIKIPHYDDWKYTTFDEMTIINAPNNVSNRLNGCAIVYCNDSRNALNTTSIKNFNEKIGDCFDIGLMQKRDISHMDFKEEALSDELRETTVAGFKAYLGEYKIIYSPQSETSKNCLPYGGENLYCRRYTFKNDKGENCLIAFVYTEQAKSDMRKLERTILKKIK